MIELRGITWNHTRGYVPMVATAQRYAELNPGVEVRWEKRSLQQFADFPVERLAESYDLLVIDHPSIGTASRKGILAPLDDLLPGSFLDDQAAHSVGRSHASYSYAGRHWALAIDAATPVSGWRPDLLDKAGATPPATWSELLDLGRRGLVAVPGIAVDTLMNFYMLCGALGEDPFEREAEVVSEEIGVQALEMLRDLLAVAPPDAIRWNPIAVWNTLSSGDRLAYCPFAYGYSNYGRRGYARHELRFGGLVKLDNGRPLRSTLGGAGLAISARCKDRQAAADYCRYVAGPDCQRSLYFDAGGQPGHRGAWLDEEVNRRCGGFFLDTLPTLDAAYLRPRYPGYLDFQDNAGNVVHNYVWGGGDPRATLRRLDELLPAAQDV